MFLLDAQDFTPDFTLFVRARSGSAIRVLMSAIEQEVRGLDPLVTKPRVQTLAQASSIGLLPQRIAAGVTATLGVVGLLLAALGIYGVMAYSVARRTRELAIRVAVGAAGADVARLILRQGLTLAATGGVIGLVLAAIGSQLLRRLLFGVPPLDPFAFGGTVLLFGAVTLLACYVPTRRATLVDPAEALRQVL